LIAPVAARSATAGYPICEKRGTTSRATEIQTAPRCTALRESLDVVDRVFGLD
jgi:hypothetical protein